MKRKKSVAAPALAKSAAVTAMGNTAAAAAIVTSRKPRRISGAPAIRPIATPREAKVP